MNAQKSRGRPGFFAKRARAIVLPYIVFSLLQGSVQIIMSGRTNSDLGVADLLLIPFIPISPFWFLYVLLIYVALVALWRPGVPMMLVAVGMTLLSPLAADSPWILFQILYFFSFYVAGALYQPGRIPSWWGWPQEKFGLRWLV